MLLCFSKNNNNQPTVRSKERSDSFTHPDHLERPQGHKPLMHQTAWLN